MKTLKAYATLLVALSLLVVSCSGDDTTASSTTAGLDSSTTTSTTALPSTTSTSTTSSTSTTAPIPPLVVWVDATLAATLDGYAADFEAATGIPVNIEAHDIGDIVPQAIESFQEGAGPDLFFGSHRWLGQLKAAGLVNDVPIPDPEAYLPLALDAFTSDGVLYGLPYTIESPALYFNKALVPEEPTGFSDLTALCESLTITGQCLGIPSDDPETHLAIVTAFGGYGYGTGENGLDITDIGLDGEGALLAADFIDEQSSAGSVIPGDEAIRLFEDGEEAFLLARPMANPGPAEWGAVPYQPAGAFESAIVAEVHGFMISSVSSQPLAAQVFLTEFVGTDEPMFDLFLASFVSPARKTAYEDAVRTDPRIAAFTPTGTETKVLLAPKPALDELLAAFGNALAVISGQQYTEATPDARTAFTQVAEALRPPESEG